MIKETFRLLAPYIVSCHAKDILIDPQPLSVHLDEVRPGLGLMDYEAFLLGVNSLPNDVPMMIEHQSSKEEYNKAREFIVSKASSIGIDL